MHYQRSTQILRTGRSSRTREDAESTTSPTPFTSLSRTSGDAILSALAQLAAFRLNTERAFIVLADGPEYHVLAEATRTVSHYDSSAHRCGDELMFGVQSCSIEFGIMYATMPAYHGEKDRFVDSDVSVINGAEACISDLQQEPAVKDLVFIQNNNSARFYAEAPLRNANGTAIAIVACLDNKPRLNFRDCDMKPLKEVARLIVEHLDLLAKIN